jgi:hypothetical protein
MRSFANSGSAFTATLLILGVAAAPGFASKPRWHVARTVEEAVDLAGPRSDGRLVVATTGASLGHLSLFRPGGALTPFARGSRGYSTTNGEPYIDVGAGRHLRYSHCTFDRDAVFALDQSAPGVVQVTPEGVASRFVNLPPGNSPTAITFDRVGRFGYRLLVAARTAGSTTIYGIDCRRQIRTFARGAPVVEGGMRVAPRGFGRFGGQLIMPDELSGNVYATSPKGKTRLILSAGTPTGPDIGVESLGFVPRRFDRRRLAAYVSSAHGDNNFGPGTRAILSLGPSALHRAGLRSGDLLGASELAGTTVAIRCARRCFARPVATGPPAGHIEGHIVFSRPDQSGSD